MKHTPTAHASQLTRQKTEISTKITDCSTTCLPQYFSHTVTVDIVLVLTWSTTKELHVLHKKCTLCLTQQTLTLFSMGRQDMPTYVIRQADRTLFHVIS